MRKDSKRYVFEKKKSRIFKWEYSRSVSDLCHSLDLTRKRHKKIEPLGHSLVSEGSTRFRASERTARGRGRHSSETVALGMLRNLVFDLLALGLGARVSKIGKISKIFQIFGGLVLGCIKTKFCKKNCVWQHFSRSTRCAYLCTAPNSTFEQKIGFKISNFRGITAHFSNLQNPEVY